MIDTGCTFCEIASGRMAAARVAEETRCVAFLDARPLFKGHTLVVPREHHETLLDLDAEALTAVFALVRRVAGALETGLTCQGTFVAVNNRVSQSVPHVHVHIVPRTKGDGLKGFFWPRQRYADDAETEDFRRRIAGALR